MTYEPKALRFFQARFERVEGSGALPSHRLFPAPQQECDDYQPAQPRGQDGEVKAHLTSVFNKLGVDSRAAAVSVAIERGLLPSQRRE